MTVALQIRDVPEEVRAALAAEAERQGRSVQSLLLALIEREARLLTNPEAFARTESLRVRLDPDPVTVLREGREDGFDRDREDLR